MSIRRSRTGAHPFRAIPGTVACILLLATACGGREPRREEPAPQGPGPGDSARQDRRPAPEFSLPDLSGRAVRLAEFRGQVVMVNFWATWCPPCLAEIPDFIALQEELGPRGLRIIGISLDDEGAAKVGPFASRNRINYTMLVNGNDAAIAYGGVEGIPTTFLLDRRGRIVERRAGVAPREHWRQAITSLLREE